MRKKWGKPILTFYIFFLIQFHDAPAQSVRNDLNSHAPRIEIPETDIRMNLKVGTDNPPDQVFFPFKNVGSDILKVRVSKTSCNCIWATAQPQNLLPGEAGLVVLKFGKNTGAREAKHTVTITTTDPTHREIPLSAEINWSGKLRVFPSSTINLGRIPRSVKRSRLLRVEAGSLYTGKLGAVVGLEKTSENIEFASRERNERSTDLAIRFQAPDTPGPFTFHLPLHTQAKDFTLTFNGVVVGQLIPTSWKIDFGNILNNEVRRRSLTIRPVADAGFVNAQCTSPNIVLEVDSQQRDAITVDVIFLPPDQYFETYEFISSIQILSTNSEVLTIPVHATIEPRN